MYATYEFYIDTYGGQSVSEFDWSKAERKAAAYIDQITYNRLKACPSVPPEVMLAVCAAVDVNQAEEAALSSVSRKVKKVSTDGYSEEYYSPTSIERQYTDERAREVGLYLPLSHPLRYAGI